MGRHFTLTGTICTSAECLGGHSALVQIVWGEDILHGGTVCTPTPVGDGNELEETFENMKEASSQTDKNKSECELACELSKTKERVVELEMKIDDLDVKYNQQLFRLSSIKDDDTKIAFYTGFSSYSYFKAFFDFLEPAASNLIY